jgi:hypothetical protein
MPRLLGGDKRRSDRQRIRERCDVLTDDMLRYAMACMGTGSPREADKLRWLWRFAIEARNTKA